MEKLTALLYLFAIDKLGNCTMAVNWKSNYKRNWGHIASKNIY